MRHVLTISLRYNTKIIMNVTQLLNLLLLLVSTLALVASAAAESSSLRGSRELTWGASRNKKKQRRGCNGRKCVEDTEITKEFQGVEVISAEDSSKNETTASETLVETKQEEDDGLPCNKKRGKCGKRKEDEGKDTLSDPEPKQNDPPCNDEGGNCNDNDDKKRSTNPQQASLRSPIQPEAVFLPVCCECKKLPCECQFDSRQDSILYKMIHGGRVDNKPFSEATACKGANCRRGVQGDGVQGASATPSAEETRKVEQALKPCTGSGCTNDARIDAVSTASTTKQEPSSAELMCCCDECTSFPCQCSCNYFTLSRAPSSFP